MTSTQTQDNNSDFPSTVLIDNTNPAMDNGALENPVRGKSQKRGPEDEDASESAIDDANGAIVPRKRQKRVAGESSTRQKRATGRNLRGKRGLLKRLTDFPLELIFEIFKYLKPLDILRLARSSKVLRGILMSRTSADIWRAARANVEGLPPLPPDLTEPQYANLAFDMSCHNCSIRCDTVVWQTRTRTCRKCLPIIFSSYAEVYDRYGLKNELSGAFCKRLREMVPHLNCYSENIKSPWRYQLEGYIPATVELFFEQLERHRRDDSDEVFEEWVDSVMNDYKPICEHAKACVEWCESKTERRTEEIASLKLKRKEAIIQKLHEIGWGKIVTMLTKEWDDLLSSHKLVNQAKELTEKVWNNIKGPLIEYLTEKRRCYAMRVRSRELQKMWEEHRNSIDPSLPVPTFGDLLQARIFDDIWQIPVEQDSIETEIHEAAQKVLSFISQWRPQAEQRVLDILRQVVPAATLTDLTLVKTVFKCSRCDDCLWYADAGICSHDCTSRKAPGSHFAQSGLPSELHSDFFSTSWDPSCIQYCQETSDKAISVLDACGLNRATTTPGEMHVLNPLFKCRFACECVCLERNFKYLVRWDRVLLRCCRNLETVDVAELDSLIESVFDEYEKLIPDVSEEVFLHRMLQLAELAELPSFLRARSDKMYCKICLRRGDDMAERMGEHLENEYVFFLPPEPFPDSFSHNVTSMSREYWNWLPGKLSLHMRSAVPIFLLKQTVLDAI
ncbi:hypothetical protein D9758_001514 [Tetrapyrgos nigripes]|uniref:F-box domain-containing protein n=1 Tax=Tetrapyrgos nigripes TaxID=182062 RepID=A0A8H5GX37_9AGAR|nr:hypothetical protein D9758_001514 [Tetrapyrgos nigripes]